MKTKALRPPRRRQAMALSLAGLIGLQVTLPTVGLALTSGPAQPEFSGFEPVGASNSVDLFSGDFTYNIPLFELPGPDGGYPFNLAYHSGVGVEDEASWVGLGWSLNPGAINRSVRGVPDDYNGEDQRLVSNTTIQKDETYTGALDIDIELFGKKRKKNPEGATFSLGLGTSVTFNNYRGWSAGLNIGPGGRSGGGNLSFGSTLGLDSGDGASLSPQVGLNASLKKFDGAFNLGGTFASREGLTSLGLSASARNFENTNPKGGAKEKWGSGSVSSNVSYLSQGYTPSVVQAYVGSNYAFSAAVGGFSGFGSLSPSMRFAYSKQELKNNGRDVPHAARGFLYHDNGLEGFGENDMSDYNRETESIGRRGTPNLAMASGTPDVYSLSGQGTGGQFVPARADLFTVTDSRSESRTTGFSVGAQLSLGAVAQLGVDPTGNWSVSKSNYPAEDLLLSGLSDDDDAPRDPLREDVYFRASGEATKHFREQTGDVSDPFRSRHSLTGGEEALQVKINGLATRNMPAPLATHLSGDNILTGRAATVPSRSDLLLYGALGREYRATSVIPLRQGDLFPGGASEAALPEFRTGLYDGVGAPAIDENFLAQYREGRAEVIAPTNGQTANPIASIGEGDVSDDYIVGFVNTNTSGVRYNYGTPLWNLRQIEATFAVDPAQRVCNTAGFEGVTSAGNSVRNTVTAIPTGNIRKVDRYRKITTTPRYVHTYLLSNILGQDYIDMTGDGVTDDDHGYWVDFRYTATASAQSTRQNKLYKWRAPYTKANLDKGSELKERDDKGSFIYGEKEQAILTEVSTKTHRAVFYSSRRDDARSARGIVDNNEISTTLDSDGLLNASYRLDKIELWAKDSDVPLQSVVFDYFDEGLCDGPNAARGKLTLRSIHTNYKDNTRGELTPYEFSYVDGSVSENGSASKYLDGTDRPADAVPYSEYTNEGQDRWGRNRVRYGAEGACETAQHPWVPQGIDRIRNDRLLGLPDPTAPPPSDSELLGDFDLDRESTLAASMWALNEITLPSGSSIQIHYERDDYAYVQDRRALQMIPIAGIRTTDGAEIPTEEVNETDRVYGEVDCDAGNTRVFFDFEEHRPGEPPLVGDPRRKVENYLYGLHGIRERDNGITSLSSSVRLTAADLKGSQVLFQLGSRLTGGQEVESITGYAEIVGYGVCETSQKGFVDLRPVRIGKGRNEANKKSYHPFAAATWQYARANFPSAVTGLSGFDNTERATGEDLARRFAGAILDVANMFSDYYSVASRKEIGKQVDLRRSFIRLATPDGVKFGGGTRVKALVIKDNWNLDADLPGDGGPQVVYGQEFDYTTERNGVAISSGVAVNEPSIGYEECALQFAKEFKDEATFRSDQAFTIEYPVNKSVLPGASVGYRQVTVRSLAGAAQRYFALGAELQKADMPAYLGPLFTFRETAVTNSGETVHEFYTAKDYPIIFKETPVAKSSPRNSVFKGILFNSTDVDFNATQGYMTVLNDMHGKQRSTSHYALDALGQRGAKVNGSSYDYYDKEVSGVSTSALVIKEVREVESSVPVVVYGEDGTAELADDTRELGLTHQMTWDFREAEIDNGSASAEINAALVPPFFGWGSVWPGANIEFGKTKTIVTNKVVRKIGMLESVSVTDGQSTQTTRNVGFDPNTGAAVLTTVTNSFDDPVYNLDIPAYTQYPGMGPASQNAGTRIELSLTAPTDADCGDYAADASGLGTAAAVLRPGDEILLTRALGLYSSSPGTEIPFIIPTAPVNRLWVEAVDANGASFRTNGSEFETRLNQRPSRIFMAGIVIRSGARNMLTSSAGAVQSFENPANGSRSYKDVLSLSSQTFNDHWIDTDGRGITAPPAEDTCSFQVVHPIFSYSTGWANPFGTGTAPADPANITHRVILNLRDMNGNVIQDIVVDNIIGDFGYNGPVIDARDGSCRTQRVIGYLVARRQPNLRYRAVIQYINNITGAVFAEYDDDQRSNPPGHPFGGGLPTALCEGQEVIALTESIACSQDFIVGASIVPTDPGARDAVEEMIHSGYQGAWLESSAREGKAYSSARSGRSDVITSLDVQGDRSASYVNLERGVWRPHRQFAFIADRTRVADRDNPTDPAAFTSSFSRLGVFSEIDANTSDTNVPVFDHRAAAYNIDPAYRHGWKATNEITAYGDAFASGEPTEERDVLGVYSSAQYDRSGYLVEAIASNARRSEIAFSGFEGPHAGALSDAGGVFDFDNSEVDEAAPEPGGWSETYNISVATEGTSFTIDYADYPEREHVQPYAASIELRGTPVGTADDDGDGIPDPVPGAGLAYSGYIQNPTLQPHGRYPEEDAAPYGTSRVTVRGQLENCTPKPSTRASWWGRVVLHYSVRPNLTEGSLRRVSGDAHTGEWAVTVNSSDAGAETASFAQPELVLHDDKRYVYTGWVKPTTSAATRAALESSVAIAGVGSDGASLVLATAPVEGWYRFEYTFTGGGSVPVLSFSPGFLFDDLRVAPEDAEMVSYVYDAEDYRVKATLDQNNYATVYKYDDQGVVIATLKETERGLKTIQETRSYTKERPQ